jgi:Protein of unknown function with HXXEE motif
MADVGQLGRLEENVVTFPRVAWCGVAVVALHNAEEALTIPTWLPPRLARLEAEFRIQPLAVDSAQLYWGLAVATLIPIFWVAVASRGGPRSIGAYSIVVLYGVFLANALVPHLLGTVLLASYVPGAVTAGLLVVPFTVWLARRGVVDGYVSKTGLAVALLFAASLYFPALRALLGVPGLAAR